MLRRRSRSMRLSGEEGSSLVEIAIAATVLFLMIFGIIQASLIDYVYVYLSDAAREATRYAIVRGSSCSSFPAACPASANDVQNYVRSLNFPVMNASSINVATTWPTTGSSCTPSSNPCNNPGNLVQVTVSYNYPLSIPFLTGRTVTVAATSQMVISQ